eukprot:473849_1
MLRISISLLVILTVLQPITIDACEGGVELCPTPRPTGAPIIVPDLEFEKIVLFEYAQDANIILMAHGNDHVCTKTIDYKKRQEVRINLKKDGACENDETRWMKITKALKGTRIWIYDHPDGEHKGDDYFKLEVLKDFTEEKSINSYEQRNYNNDPANDGFFQFTYHWHNGLDGKVSRIEIYPPEREIDSTGLIDTRFDAASNDRETNFISTVWKFDDVDTSISSLKSYLKTEFDAQSEMINSRFGESAANVNFEFTSSNDNINSKFTSSTNNINSQFIRSTDNINHQFSLSTNNINNQFALSTSNINKKYNSLSTQITVRMDSLADNTNNNFTASTTNINYQFGVSTTNINQKYNLLSNQMNVQSAMITTRFNT